MYNDYCRFDNNLKRGERSQRSLGLDILRAVVRGQNNDYSIQVNRAIYLYFIDLTTPYKWNKWSNEPQIDQVRYSGVRGLDKSIIFHTAKL